MANWWSNNWGKFLVGVFTTIIFGLTALWIYVANWWAFVDNYEVGYRFNARTGEMSVLERTGWIQKQPFFELIGTIDTRPMQVCINANSRVLNCKLVRFNPAGIETFLEWHGRDWRNSSTLDQILMSYAYDGTGRNYPFLTILRELKSQDIDAAALNDVAPIASEAEPGQ